MEHGLSHFLLPSPLYRFPFLLSNVELLIDALNGHERVLCGGLHGGPELVLLPAKLNGKPFQDLWGIPPGSSAKYAGRMRTPQSWRSSHWCRSVGGRMRLWRGKQGVQLIRQGPEN